MFRILLKVIASALALIAASIFFLVLYLNPNDYKSELESTARSQLGLLIEINGDITWTFWPLGFRVSNLVLKEQNSELFTEVEQLDLSVDTLSLLRLEPQVNGFDLIGAQINLTVDAQGSTNWSNLIKAKPSSSYGAADVTGVSDADDDSEQVKTTANSSSANAGEGEGETAPLVFLIKSINLKDLSIRYRNEVDSLAANVSHLNINLRDIGFDRNFSVDINYVLNNQAPSLKVAHSISTQARFNQGFSEVVLEGLVSSFDYLGPSDQLQPNISEASKSQEFPIKIPQKLSLISDVVVNRQAQTIKIPKLQVSGAGLAIDGEVLIEDFEDDLSVSGNMSLAPFSIWKLLSGLGIDPKQLGELQFVPRNSLESVSLSSPFSFKRNNVSLPTFELNLDETNFLGRLDHHLVTGQSSLTLKGDTLDLNRYMPVRKDDSSVPEQSNSAEQNNAASYADSKQDQLFPVASLRELGFDFNLILDSLLVREYMLQNLEADVTASRGLVSINKLNADLLEGSAAVSGSLDARTAVPTLKARATIDGVNAFDHFESIDLYGYSIRGLGRVSITTDLTMSGNDQDTLLRNNHGEMSIKLDEGAIYGVDLEALVCSGFALLNGEKNTTKNKDPMTDLNELDAKITFKDGLLNNTALKLRAAGFNGSGAGSVDLNQHDLGYNFNLFAAGSDQNSACRVNEKWQGVAIPIRCAGDIANPDTVGCELNQKKLLRTIEKQAKKEAERKIEKEVDRAIDKQLDQSLDKYLDKDSELSKQLKDSFRGLFK